MFNKLLLRQIQKHLGNSSELPEDLQSFLKAISDSYDHFEKDRNMLERSVELTSCEMIELNTRLRNEAQETKNAHTQLKTLFENIDDVFFTVDMINRKTLQMSPACESVYGYTVEEFFINSTLWYDVVVEEDRGIIQKNYPKMFAGKRFSHEHRIRTKAGEIKWIVTKITPTLDEKGTLIRIDGITTDITERKAAEEKIQRSEKIMSEAERIAHIGSWEMDLSNKQDLSKNYLYWSDEVFRIFGYDAGEFEVNSNVFFKAIYHEDITLVKDALEKAMHESSHYKLDHRIIHPNGCIRWVRANAHFLIDKSTGKGLKMIGTVMDITESKMKELAIKNAEANLRNILENTDTAYVLLDKNSSVLSFNHVAKELSNHQTGVTITEGINYIDLMLDDRKKNVKEKLKEILREQTKVNYETRYIGIDGRTCWLAVSMHPILNVDKEILGLSIAAKDITERKNMEFERIKITNDLIQRNKDLEQFTYIISHNLRAPVANILGLSTLMKSTNITTQIKEECMEGLEKSVKRLDDVVIDLNNVIQIRRDISEKKETTRFSSTVNNIIDSIRGLIEKEKVIINSNFSEIDEMITIKSYLYSVFFNLISNSIKYRKADESPVIDITSIKDEKKIILIFKDNCMGIDLKLNKDKVFGLYKRFHANIEGKGMGLYMVKTQVETLGGKVNIKSEVNKGTEISIEFEN